MPRRLSPVLAAAAAAVALAGCASVSNGAPTSAATPKTQSSSASGPSSSTETTPTAFPSSSADSSSSSGGGLTMTEAFGALLTAADLGTGFVNDTPSDSDPLPCTPNDPPLDEQIPAQVNVQKAFSAQSGAVYFNEQIETFTDAATVAKVITAGTKGLDCKTATVNGQAVTISGPQDLSTSITTPVDQAKAWSISQGSAGQGIVAVQLGQHLVVLTFASASTANTDNLPDSGKLANEAIARVAAAIP